MEMFNDNIASEPLSYQGNLVRVSGRVDDLEKLQLITGSSNQVYLVGLADAAEWDKYLWNIATSGWEYIGKSRLMSWSDLTTDISNLKAEVGAGFETMSEEMAELAGVTSTPESEQEYVEGTGNRFFGTGNLVYGNNNIIIGSNNVVIGDGQFVVGQGKRISGGNVSHCNYDYWSGIITVDTIEGIPAVGDMVYFVINYSCYDNNYENSVSIKSEPVTTQVTNVYYNEGYSAYVIEIADAFPLPQPPSEYPNVDGAGFDIFVALEDEFKIPENNSITFGVTANGDGAFSTNNANARGRSSFASNAAFASGWGTFASNTAFANGSYDCAVNSGIADGNSAFAANSGKSLGTKTTAFGDSSVYAIYSTGFGKGEAYHVAIQVVSIDLFSNQIGLAYSPSSHISVGDDIILYYNSSIINQHLRNYLKTKVTEIDGATITIETNMAALDTNFSIGDGYIYIPKVTKYGVVDACNAAFGESIASSVRALSHGNRTVAVHTDSAIFGRYGKTPDTGSISLGNGTSPANEGLAVKMLKNGNIDADGTLSSPAADYAEMFEWFDGNPNNEDRVGYFVNLIGEKIHKTEATDESAFGIVSANPAFIGDSAELRWGGKYITDDFGRIQYHEVLIEAEFDEEGNIAVSGRTEMQPVLNPEWDNSQSYVSRADRKEWAAVGVLGKLVVYDDGTCTAGGRCKPAAGGVATAAETGYHVLRRIANDKILVWLS